MGRVIPLTVYRALIVVAIVLELPVLARIARMSTPAPRERELDVPDAPASVFVPGRGQAHPTLLLMNGATPQGRRHPMIRRLAGALARAGFRVVVPDVYGVDRGEISDRAVAATLAVAGETPGPIAFVGISVGTTLALLAAEDPSLAGRVSVVAGTTGYVDLPDLIRIATTERFESAPFLFTCVDCSVRACAPGGAVDALLANRDPSRFTQLYARLPSEVVTAIERLSPVHGAERLRAPVYLLADPRDKYFPLEHIARLPCADVTTTGLLQHADVGFSLRDLPDLVRLGALVVRTLRAARATR
jgi:pimeloyl-ACP methyl ester carboxylesterase